MSERDATNSGRLSAYLDGVLSPAEREEFERTMASDNALRAAVDLQRRIDDRVRVLGAAPVFPGLDAAMPAPAAGRTVPRRGLPAWLRVAAAIALATAGVWAVTTKPWNSLFAPPPSLSAADAVYERLVRSGFTPDWVCTTDQEFASYTAKELGTPFTVTAAEGVRLVGWTYADGILGEHAKVLLVRHGETPVMVVMDLIAHDRTVRVSPESGLKVHRGTVGGGGGEVVLYEFSPSCQPVVVGRTAPRE